MRRETRCYLLPFSFKLSALLMQHQPLCSVANLFWHSPRCNLKFTLGHFSAAQLPSHMLPWKVTLLALVGDLSHFGWQHLPFSPFCRSPIGPYGKNAFETAHWWTDRCADMHSSPGCLCLWGIFVHYNQFRYKTSPLDNLIPSHQCNKLI